VSNPRVTVLIGDSNIDLALPGTWNFEEAKLAKRVSADPDIGQAGYTPAQVEAGLRSGDPDAWLALLRVSYMRQGDDWPGNSILNEVVGEVIDKYNDAIREAAREEEEEAGALPPTPPQPSSEPGPDAEPPSGSAEDQS
jgi:hypothetical protein